MSVKAMNHVWEKSKQTGAALLVMLAIADAANDDGFCWLGMAKLARKCRQQPKNTRKYIQQAERDGELLVYERTHDDNPDLNHSNLYQITGLSGAATTPPPDLKGVVGAAPRAITPAPTPKNARTPKNGSTPPPKIGSTPLPKLGARSKNRSKTPETRSVSPREPKPYEVVPKHERLLIIKAWSDSLSIAPVNPAGQEKNHVAAAELYRDGYRAGHVERYVRAQMNDGYWIGKTLTLAKVGELMPTWLAAQPTTSLQPDQPAGKFYRGGGVEEDDV